MTAPLRLAPVRSDPWKFTRSMRRPDRSAVLRSQSVHTESRLISQPRTQYTPSMVSIGRVVVVVVVVLVVVVVEVVVSCSCFGSVNATVVVVVAVGMLTVSVCWVCWVCAEFVTRTVIVMGAAVVVVV